MEKSNVHVVTASEEYYKNRLRVRYRTFHNKMCDKVINVRRQEIVDYKI